MKKIVSAITILIAFNFIVCSCKGMNSFSGNYGYFRQDITAETDFMTFQMRPGYKYYSYGPHDFPDVLFGLKSQYELEPGVFNPVLMTPEKMKSLVLDMQHRAYSNSDILRGFYIFKNDGEIIGEWYSPYLFHSIITVRDNVVSISYPDFPNRPHGRPDPEGDVH